MSLSKSKQDRIATTLKSQLGGQDFMFFVNAHSLTTLKTGGISFGIDREESKYNSVIIKYSRGSDLYSIGFKKDGIETKVMNEIFFDQLQELIIETLGLPIEKEKQKTTKPSMN